MLKILVVDDTPDVLKTICGTFEDAGYSVYPASNQSEALNVVFEVSVNLFL